MGGNHPPQPLLSISGSSSAAAFITEPSKIARVYVSGCVHTQAIVEWQDRVWQRMSVCNVTPRRELAQRRARHRATNCFGRRASAFYERSVLLSSLERAFLLCLGVSTPKKLPRLVTVNSPCTEFATRRDVSSARIRAFLGMSWPRRSSVTWDS